MSILVLALGKLVLEGDDPFPLCVCGWVVGE